MREPLPFTDFRLQYLPDKGELWIRGWLLFLDGPADQVGCRVAGIDPVEIDRASWAEMKEAFPHIPNAEMSGIEMHLPAPDLQPGQTIEFTIMAGRDGKLVAEVPVAYRRPDEDIPLPSPELARRVSGSRSLETFLSSGNVHANAVVRLLRPHIDLTQVQSFLDWGCGCGRITLHLARMLPNARIHGTDVDAQAIAWLSSAMPEGEFHATGESPPLPFDDNSFDLVLASSVFTHLSKAHQQAWLHEILRVLKPGGLLTATTHGWHTAAWFRMPEVTADMEQSGFSDRKVDDDLGDVVSSGYYRSTFQTPEYTRSNWCTVLDEVAMIPAAMNLHQDVWILRKR